MSRKAHKPDTRTAMRQLIDRVRNEIPFGLPEEALCGDTCKGCSTKLLIYLETELDEWETNEIIEVPLSVLLDKDCVRQETDVLDGQVIPTYFYHYQGKVIWGATARILKQFLDILASVMESK